jgi:putative transcriptional regulator
MKSETAFEKMSVFDQIRHGLKDAIAHARGEVTLRTTTLPAPAPKLTKARVIAIRKRTGMSQAVFACYLNVPTKTLQSWEQGARVPKAGEARLLQIFETAPGEVMKLVAGPKSAAPRSAQTRKRRPPAAA